MKFSTVFAFITAAAPMAFALPSDALARRHKIPTCAAETCLSSTNGLFDGCVTNDLACLCRLDQPEVARYVTAVQPCIDGDAGHIACTAGGIQEYKDVLRNVCNTEQFGYKQVVFPQPEETS